MECRDHMSTRAPVTRLLRSITDGMEGTEKDICPNTSEQEEDLKQSCCKLGQHLHTIAQATKVDPEEGKHVSVKWTNQDTTGNGREGGQNGKNPTPRHVQQ